MMRQKVRHVVDDGDDDDRALVVFTVHCCRGRGYSTLKAGR